MITALLVSVNYSDYLEVALSYNTKQFDKIIVLTIESDKACQEVCSKHSNVKCLVYSDEILKKNGAKFNKGAIMNKGLEYLNSIKYSDWLVLTDSDIIFPENFKDLLLSKNKDLNILFSMKRKCCVDSKTLKEYSETKNDTLLEIVRGDMDFIGFCQIFIYQPDKIKFYEEYNADVYDLLFLIDFNKNMQTFYSKKPTYQEIFPLLAKEVRGSPNFILFPNNNFVIHLGEIKKNWRGRITEKFI